MLAVNENAPEFTLKDQDGNEHTLSTYSGKNVVLYFYPKDDTPGCTKEAVGFSEKKSEFETLNTVIIGVSRDSVEKHQAFCTKYDLNITLLSDTEPFITESYGVWQEKKNYGKTYMGIVRSTFLINSNGKIENVWTKVKVDGHVDAVLDQVKKLAS